MTQLYRIEKDGCGKLFRTLQDAIDESARLPQQWGVGSAFSIVDGWVCRFGHLCHADEDICERCADYAHDALHDHYPEECEKCAEEVGSDDS